MLFLIVYLIIVESIMLIFGYKNSMMFLLAYLQVSSFQVNMLEIVLLITFQFHAPKKIKNNNISIPGSI